MKTLRISAFICGAVLLACGGGGGGTGEPLDVSGDVSAETTWSPSAADCDVQVTGVVAVKSKLTISPGTKVCFKANAGLLVDETGSLHAVGTASERITFTGTSETKGYWKGLAFLSNDNANALQFVDLSYAGNTDPFCCGFFVSNENMVAAVVVGDYNTGGLVSIQDSTISKSGGLGVFAAESSRLTGFARNTFSDNTGAPVAVSLAAVNDLDTATSYSGGSAPNGKNFVRVLRYADTTIPVTMHKLDVPYGMSEGFAGGVFRATATLTIEAGAKLEFEANSGIVVASTGQLQVQGTPSDRVVFTGRSATPGYWKGLAVLGATNSISHADITYAGNDDSFCCGFYEPGGSASARAGIVAGDYQTSAGLTINTVNVTQSKHRGVVVSKGALTQEGTNDLSTGNAEANLL